MDRTIPSYFTPFRIKPRMHPARGIMGHVAVWERRSERDSANSPDASPVLFGGPDRVRAYMATVYTETREVKGGPMQQYPG
jgi:hypothetical protein